jgi:hypothetical protein
MVFNPPSSVFSPRKTTYYNAHCAPCLFIDGHGHSRAQLLKTINGIARHQTLLALSEMATDLSKPRLRLIKDFYFFLFQSSFLPYFSRSTSDFLLFFFFVIFRRFYMNNLISPITTTETNSPMDIVDYL